MPTCLIKSNRRSSTGTLCPGGQTSQYPTYHSGSTRQGRERRHSSEPIALWNAAAGRNDDEVDMASRPTVMVRVGSFSATDALKEERWVSCGVDNAGEMARNADVPRRKRTSVSDMAQKEFCEDGNDGNVSIGIDDDVTSPAHTSQSGSEIEDSRGHKPDTLGALANGLEALFTQLDDATAQRERHIDRIENNVWNSIPAAPHEETTMGGSTGTNVLSAVLPEFAKQFGDFLPDFFLPDKHAHSSADSPCAAKPFRVSTKPTAAHDMPCIRVEEEEVALSGFVMLAPSRAPSSEKVRNAKSAPIRWAQITKGPENEWMLLWYHARYHSKTDEKDDERFAIINGMSVDKNSVCALTTLTGSSIVDHGVEAMTRDGSVVMHFFSVYPPPHVGYPIDFACEKAEDSGRWIAALRACTNFRVDEKLSATLQISIREVNLKADGKRKVPHPFVLIKYDRFVSRTGTVYDKGPTRFEHSCAFPIVYDDPDSFVHLEVWDAGQRGSSEDHRLLGSLNAPLQTFERNSLKSITLKLRSMDLIERGFVQEGSDIGEINVQYVFEQPLLSLFLPLPRVRLRQQKETQRLKNMEGSLRNRSVAEHKHFNMFTARLLKHADAAKQLSNYFNEVTWWMNVAQTVSWLLVLTLYILWLYAYTLPLVVFLLLLVSIVKHPYWWSLPSDCWLSQCYNSVCGSLHLCSPDDLAPAPIEDDKESVAAEADGLRPKVLEAFENERRLAFGRWSAKRLYWWDPPAWADCLTGDAIKAPEWVISGVSYRWNVQINEYTDENGWQYSSSFREGMWSNSFFLMSSFVRRRKHIGTPVATSEDTAALMQRSPAVYPEKEESRTPTICQKVIDAAPHREVFEKLLIRLRFHERIWAYWLDFVERRRNLFAGKQSFVSSVMVSILSVVLLAALVVPTRYLILGYVYLYFWAGWSDGVYYRTIRDQMIQELKDETSRRQLSPKVTAKWNSETPMKEVVEVFGVLALREWLTREYLFEVPVPLKAINESKRLENLARFVIFGSLKFIRRREKRRAWWKISFSAFVDHVPSDACTYDAASVTYFKSSDPAVQRQNAVRR